MCLAVQNGDLDMVKWFHENRTEGCTRDALVMAAMHGFLDIVQWLVKNCPELRTTITTAIEWASCRGDPEVASWLRNYEKTL